ncbi:uncharacterized protein HD556DRAFT_1308628 [Suillus plorans]|uniref:Uncharacterized protein n=1 Tax=Suillus plorans TaxID=116603 RepID=A0A9P7APJ3_9AGAM|nr:uncharacterized protein HD556DRAFT_1308628 [Suillus plorans]KAG1793491.1 hypothetical protein HD556DRAFT_1308628 [Suillus plorans]
MASFYSTQSYAITDPRAFEPLPEALRSTSLVNKPSKPLGAGCSLSRQALSSCCLTIGHSPGLLVSTMSHNALDTASPGLLGLGNLIEAGTTPAPSTYHPLVPSRQSALLPGKVLLLVLLRDTELVVLLRSKYFDYVFFCYL